MENELHENSGQNTRRRRRLGFYGILLLVFAGFIIAIGVGALIFREYIKAYEDSRIDYIIKQLQDNIDYGFWEQNAENAISARLTEFETGGPVPLSPHLSQIRDVRYVLRQKSDESAAEAPVYIIRAGSRDIGIVRFIPTESVGYGYYRWDVGSIEFLDGFVDDFSKSIHIIASQNAQVLVNGVPVSQGYRIDCEYEYGAAYLINGIFGDIDIEVFEFDGTESSPYHIEHDWYFYPITIPFTREFNIIVPEDAAVYADGEQIDYRRITDDSIEPSVFYGAVEPADVPVHLNRYEFEMVDVYTEPVITVLDAQGRALSPQESADGETMYAAEFSSLYKEQYSETVETFIRAYINYSANVGGNIGGNISNLNNYILRNSELYRRVQSSRPAMEWVGATSAVYNSLEIDNFMPYGDSYFSCEVSYDVTNRTHGGIRELVGRFEVLFFLSGGRWLAINVVSI